MMAWNACAIVISNAYTGNMLSYLLIHHRSPTVNSLEELTASSLLYIVRGGVSTETLFLVVKHCLLTKRGVFTSRISRAFHSIIKEAKKTEKFYWKVGEFFRKHPELIFEPTPDRRQRIKNLVIAGKHAYIAVLFY